MPILADEMVKLLQAEIGREFYAHSFYTQAGILCEQAAYFGAAKFMRAAAADELKHRDGFVQYLVDFDLPATMPPVDAPPTAWKSLPALFEAAITLELDVTVAINDLQTQAHKRLDWLTAQFLDPYVEEQRKSVAELLNVRRLLRQFGADPAALLQVDAQLGEMVDQAAG